MNQHVDVAGQTGVVEALLADYASGALPSSLHALMASHLVLSPTNRAFVGALEASRARDLALTAAAPLRDRDNRLAAIFGAAPAPFVAALGDDVIPAPIAAFLGKDFSSVPWRSRGFGIKEYHVEDRDGVESSLYWVKAGRQLPSHTHDGSEITLVLKGAFSDARQHYERGDIAFADHDIDHRPMIDPDCDCVCFAVTDAPLRLTGPIGRIFQRFFVN